MRVERPHLLCSPVAAAGRWSLDKSNILFQLPTQPWWPPTLNPSGSQPINQPTPQKPGGAPQYRSGYTFNSHTAAAGPGPVQLQHISPNHGGTTRLWIYWRALESVLASSKDFEMDDRQLVVYIKLPTSKLQYPGTLLDPCSCCCCCSCLGPLNYVGQVLRHRPLFGPGNIIFLAAHPKLKYGSLISDINYNFFSALVNGYYHLLWGSFSFAWSAV